MATKKDLEFLYHAENEDLRILVDYLTKNKNGDARLTECLTETEEYKKYYPHNLNLMVESIIDELQRFGGNTFLNIIRGGGVEYRKILIKVAKKKKVNFKKESSVEVIETYLLQKILTDSIENASMEDLEKMAKEMQIHTAGLEKEAIIALIQAEIRRKGFYYYKMVVVIANKIAKLILGRGLPLILNATLTRALSIFSGPIGWTILAIWTAFDIAGPAYRVIIPSVIHIAYMRMKYLNPSFSEQMKE